MPLTRDAMQPNVVSLRRDQTVSEAAAVLVAHDVSGAPVCARGGRVLGVFSKTDVAECAARSELQGSVEDAMSRVVISVGADEPLERAVSLMAFEGVHRLIVVDADARLVGVISAMDVLRELAGHGRRRTRRVIATGPPDWATEG